MTAVAAKAVTPADLAITPRDRRFARGEATPRWWAAGDPYATALYNALSATFPMGEAFFVESVRAYMKDAPSALKEDICNFTTQEAVHSREHLAFNKRATDSGYDLSSLEERVRERFVAMKARPQIASLAATTALEHFTAILGHELLADPRHLDGADPETAALWRWHAAEEIEHKGVAYDTWLHATRDWTRFKRWKVKAKVMLFITHIFLVGRIKGALELLRQDGITGPRAVFGLMRTMWVTPGMFRKIFGAWAAYFMPGFHPWNEDDRALIAQYEESAPKSAKPARQVRRAKAA